MIFVCVRTSQLNEIHFLKKFKKFLRKINKIFVQNKKKLLKTIHHSHINQFLKQTKSNPNTHNALFLFIHHISFVSFTYVHTNERQRTRICMNDSKKTSFVHTQTQTKKNHLRQFLEECECVWNMIENGTNTHTHVLIKVVDDRCYFFIHPYFLEETTTYNYRRREMFILRVNNTKCMIKCVCVCVRTKICMLLFVWIARDGLY